MSATHPSSVASGPLQAHAFRLHPGDDLIPSLQHAVGMIYKNTGAQSCFAMTAVGSLSAVALRLANANRQGGQQECDNANDIRYMSISDAKGVTFGGHLVSGTVFTTMEIVLGTIQGASFKRTMDPMTGYRELSVEEAPESASKHED